MKASVTRLLTSVSAAVLVLFVAACADPEPQAPVYLVGGGNTAGIYTEAAAAFAKVVNDREDTNEFRLKLHTGTGSVANINGLMSGEIQFGIAQADDQYNAVNGLADWEGQPQIDLRAVFGVYTEVVTVFAGADTEIRTLADLRGKRVDIGPAGSGTRRHAIAALQAAGIDWQTDISIHEGVADDRIYDFDKRKSDVVFLTIGHPNKEVGFAMASERGARLVSLANIDELLAASSFFTATTIPADLYPRAADAADIQTVGVRAVLLTSAQVPDDVIYSATRAVFANTSDYSTLYPSLAMLVDRQYFDGVAAPLHAGAVRYYEDAEVPVPAGAL